MNLLFVTPTPPFPPTDGARLMMANLARTLSAQHTLSLVTLTDAAALNSPQPHFANVHAIPQNIAPRWRKWAFSFVDDLPLWVRVCESAALRAALPELVARWGIQVAHLDTGMMAQYVHALGNLPTVLAPHDSLTMQLRDRARNARDWRMRFVMRVQSEKMRRYEATYYRRATRVCVVTQREREFLETVASGLDARVIPNGVDTNFFAPQEIPLVPNTIGFLGAMDYAPNQAAAFFFAEKVLPEIWRVVPDVTFTMIGRNPPPEIRALTKDARIRVTGTVDDVRPHVAAQTIMVCPVLAAGGMKFKLLETLAMGKAVVATPAAAEGAEVRDQVEVCLAREANEFSAACVNLLRNENARAHLEKNARRWALEHAWERTAAHYESLYREALDAALVR